MNTIMKFITNYFNLTVLSLFLIASFFLILLDSKEYKKEGLKTEYTFSKIVGYIYIIGGFAVYIVANYIKM